MQLWGGSVWGGEEGGFGNAKTYNASLKVVACAKRRNAVSPLAIARQLARSADALLGTLVRRVFGWSAALSLVSQYPPMAIVHVVENDHEEDLEDENGLLFDRQYQHRNRRYLGVGSRHRLDRRKSRCSFRSEGMILWVPDCENRRTLPLRSTGGDIVISNAQHSRQTASSGNLCLKDRNGSLTSAFGWPTHNPSSGFVPNKAVQAPGVLHVPD